MDHNDELMWWAYLHQDGALRLKRWFGDHADYTTDCEGNEFVQRVMKPFPATDRFTALELASEHLLGKSRV